MQHQFDWPNLFNKMIIIQFQFDIKLIIAS